MANRDEPAVGQTVWTQQQGNGIITRIDYRGKNVYVNHYEKGHAVYEMHELEGHFDERLNQWVIS